MKKLISATGFIVCLISLICCSSSRGVGTRPGHSYIRIDNHSFLCKNKDIASISKCTTSLSEGYNTGFIGIFKDLNSKRVGKLSLDYSYLNSIGVTSMIAANINLSN
jgi:hypothetical protein